MRNIKEFWWDNLKYDIKKISIRYSAMLYKFRKQEERRVKQELQRELEKWEEKRGEEALNKVIALEDKLRTIEELECKGAILRSKIQYAIEGERCTKFFF